MDRGLELFGRGEVEPAVRCWQQVLELVPEHPEALDYLHSALGDLPAPLKSEAVRRSGVDRELVSALLAQGNYEDAWLLLEDALRLHPDDVALTRARDLLESRAALGIAKSMRLSVPPRIVAETADSRANLSVLQSELLRLAETSRDYAQILAKSPHGEAETLRGLRSLEQLGILEPAPSAPPTPMAQDDHAELALDLGNVEGLKHFEIRTGQHGAMTAPSEADSSGPAPRLVSELTAALRLLGQDEVVDEIAVLRADEVQIMRRIRPRGPTVLASVDRSMSHLALARLQVQLACESQEGRS